MRTGKVELETWDPFIGPRTQDPLSGTQNLGPFRRDSEAQNF